MKLVEMTEDQAIELCLREIPEIVVPWDGDVIGENHCGCCPPTGAYAALFFRAAWVWLQHDEDDKVREPISVTVIGGDEWAVYDDSRGPDELDGYDAEVYPTEIHALVAACLLAAGKKLPE